MPGESDLCGDGGNTARKLCIDFANGKCWRDKCKFLHGTPDDLRSADASSPCALEEVASTSNSSLYKELGEFSGTTDSEGMRQGFGLWKGDAGDTYEGDFLNGLRHGFGKYTSADRKVLYEGTWVRGVKEGNGNSRD